MGVKSQIKLIKHILKLEFKSAIAYKYNFIIQTLGMIVNDLFWLVFWYFFFIKIDSINGWTFNSMLYAYAVVLLSWSLAFLIFGNIRLISKIIEEGHLDYYLSLPKEILSHTVIKLRYSTAGDFVLGIIVFVIVIPLVKWPLFISLVLFSGLIFASVGIIAGSMSFYFGKFERVSKLASETMLSFSLYPFSIYSGFTKFILLSLIPAGFASGIPIQLLQNFDWTWYIATMLFSVTIFALAIFIFYRGLKRYESGSSINIRM